MMMDIDLVLEHLSSEPVPAGLAAIDGGALAGLARHRETQAARGGLLLAGGVAVLVGLAGAVAPSTPAYAEPLLGLPAAAPSNLLVD